MAGEPQIELTDSGKFYLPVSPLTVETTEELFNAMDQVMFELAHMREDDHTDGVPREWLS